MKRSVIKGIVIPPTEYELEKALDFADKVAESTLRRYNRNEVFDKIRTKINDKRNKDKIV